MYSGDYYAGDAGVWDACLRAPFQGFNVHALGQTSLPVNV